MDGVVDQYFSGLPSATIIYTTFQNFQNRLITNDCSFEIIKKNYSASKYQIRNVYSKNELKKLYKMITIKNSVRR